LLEAAKAAGVIAASDTLTTISVAEVTTDNKNKSVVQPANETAHVS
jgi:hypothetical protein